jgi:hypothetical protein
MGQEKTPLASIRQQSLLQVMQLMHLLQIRLVKSSHIFESGIREQYLI